ncbi:MAG: CinA family protein [Rhizobiaceae bacterium]
MIADLSQRIIERGTELNVHIATAESCTGGLIAGALTEIAGSSAVVDRGFVTYSNEAKNELLNVPMDVINDKGAVSGTVARAMVAGALANSRAQIAVAVTGVAGPGGGTEEKPVGLVYIAVQSLDGLARIKECRFADLGATNRQQVREMTVQTALEMLLAELG